jgi:hypothetical protein
MHRSCFAQEPLEPISPKDVQSLRNPEIKFLAVPSSDLRITGAFQSRLRPLLQKLGIDDNKENPDTVVVPCLKRQIPAITSRFPRVQVLPSPPVNARAQAATRTVSLAPELESPYHLKLALACFITSALRTVSPWTACVGPEVGEVLSDVLPRNLWVAREVASVTGGGDDFDEAKHISCVLREDLEPRANALGEALIPAAALAETDLATGISSAQRVFGLDTIEKRRGWLRSYVSTLLGLVVPPALESGVALEAHGQNMLVRVNRSTKEVAGFVVRFVRVMESFDPKPFIFPQTFCVGALANRSTGTLAASKFTCRRYARGDSPSTAPYLAASLPPMSEKRPGIFSITLFSTIILITWFSRSACTATGVGPLSARS